MKDLDAWIGPMRPLRDCIRIVLKLLRESGQTTRIVAAQGSFQQMLGRQVLPDAAGQTG